MIAIEKLSTQGIDASRRVENYAGNKKGAGSLRTMTFSAFPALLRRYVSTILVATWCVFLIPERPIFASILVTVTAAVEFHRRNKLWDLRLFAENRDKPLPIVSGSASLRDLFTLCAVSVICTVAQVAASAAELNDSRILAAVCFAFAMIVGSFIGTRFVMTGAIAPHEVIFSMQFLPGPLFIVEFARGKFRIFLSALIRIILGASMIAPIFIVSNIFSSSIDTIGAVILFSMYCMVYIGLTITCQAIIIISWIGLPEEVGV